MLNIQQAREEKRKAEAEILQILRDFTAKTELSVASVNFTYATQIGNKHMYGPVSADITVYI